MKIAPLSDWPMSHLVMCTGIVLALATGARVVTAAQTHPWDPPESWLLFIIGCLTATFATKRLTWKPETPQDKGTDPMPPAGDPAKE